MIFVFGPLCSGKRTAVKRLLGWDDAQLSQRAVWDVQHRAAACDDLSALATELAQHEVVIATEVGSGVVPTDPHERSAREAAGRLGELLAARADTVIRVFCGIPMVLKGKLP